jgi:hypothetical protein
MRILAILFSVTTLTACGIWKEFIDQNTWNIARGTARTCAKELIETKREPTADDPDLQVEVRADWLSDQIYECMRLMSGDVLHD